VRDIRYLDLRKLLGGDYIITAYTLAKNGHSYTTKALIDSGANGFALIDKTFLCKLTPFFKPFTARLLKPLKVKGYNGQPGATIDRFEKALHQLKFSIEQTVSEMGYGTNADRFEVFAVVMCGERIGFFATRSLPLRLT
jgi:hypothetical protein